MLRVAGVDVFTGNWVSTNEKQKKETNGIFSVSLALEDQKQRTKRDRTQCTFVSTTVGVIAQCCFLKREKESRYLG